MRHRDNQYLKARRKKKLCLPPESNNRLFHASGNLRNATQVPCPRMIDGVITWQKVFVVVDTLSKCHHDISCKEPFSFLRPCCLVHGSTAAAVNAVITRLVYDFRDAKMLRYRNNGKLSTRGCLNTPSTALSSLQSLEPLSANVISVDIKKLRRTSRCCKKIRYGASCSHWISMEKKVIRNYPSSFRTIIKTFPWR